MGTRIIRENVISVLMAMLIAAIMAFSVLAIADVGMPVLDAAVSSSAVVTEAVPVVTQPVTAPAVINVIAEPPWWKLLLRHGLELIFAIVGLLAAGFISVLLKKYGFSSYNEKVEDVLDKAIGFAEQKALKLAKLDGTIPSGTNKMEMAVNFAVAMAKEYKLPEKSRDWWEDRVEAWLGVTK